MDYKIVYVSDLKNFPKLHQFAGEPQKTWLNRHPVLMDEQNAIYLTTKDIAHFIGCSGSKVNKLLAKNSIESVKYRPEGSGRGATALRHYFALTDLFPLRDQLLQDHRLLHTTSPDNESTELKGNGNETEPDDMGTNPVRRDGDAKPNGSQGFHQNAVNRGIRFYVHDGKVEMEMDDYKVGSDTYGAIVAEIEQIQNEFESHKDDIKVVVREAAVVEAFQELIGRPNSIDKRVLTDTLDMLSKTLVA